MKANRVLKDTTGPAKEKNLAFKAFQCLMAKCNGTVEAVKILTFADT